MIIWGMPSPMGAMTRRIKSMRQIIMSWSCSYSRKASQPASPNIVLCPKAFLLDTEFGQRNKIGALLQIVRLRAWYNKQESLSKLHHSKKHNQSKERLSLSKGTLKKLQNLKSECFQKRDNVRETTTTQTATKKSRL